MFSLFRRFSRKDALQARALLSKPPVPQQEQPETPNVDHDREGRQLTQASWPPKAKKPDPIMWGGGCCG